MSISGIIEKIRNKVDDPSFPALAEWKERNPEGFAIGYFPIYAPVEIIHAAGMLPVLVAGAMGRVKLDEADGYLQSFVCSVGRSTMELKLDGHLDNLDGMIFPSTCEISRGLSGVLRRHDPVKPIMYIHFPQNLESGYAKNYLLSELQRVRDALEEMSGRVIKDEAIFESFKAYNKRADLIGRLEEYRGQHPEQLSGSESYILRMAGMQVPVEEHSRILEEALTVLETSEKRHEVKMRMVLTGAFCERPPIDMMESIEKEGIAIIADDILLGQRWWHKPLRTEGNPMEILAEQYISETVYSSVVYRPSIAPCKSLLDTIRATEADGVIISSAKSCHPANYDNQCIKELCEHEGFPYIRLEYEEDQRVFESMRVQVEALIEARARLPFAGTEKAKGVLTEE